MDETRRGGEIEIMVLAETTRHKFSVKEYLALFDRGIVSDTHKTELINGEILQLSPLGHRHAKTQRLIERFLVKVLGTDEVYLTGSIIAGETNMPEPDVYVLKPDTEIAGNYPSAEQVSMVVEVADSTIGTDLINDGSGKLGIYAAAGIARLWVVDVKHATIHEFEQPSGTIYRNCKIHIGTVELFDHTASIDELIAL